MDFIQGFEHVVSFILYKRSILQSYTRIKLLVAYSEVLSFGMRNVRVIVVKYKFSKLKTLEIVAY